MEYWNLVQDAREEYLEQIRFGNSGKEVSIKISKIIPLLQSLNKKVDDGLEKAIKMNKMRLYQHIWSMKQLRMKLLKISSILLIIYQMLKYIPLKAAHYRFS